MIGPKANHAGTPQFGRATADFFHQSDEVQAVLAFLIGLGKLFDKGQDIGVVDPGFEDILSGIRHATNLRPKPRIRG